ncbi:LacI family transcriptional regulator [Candidatus Planktophila dulcis]|jgi:LacI family transcriptional regulator|uniref:LacI family transcriptional regulator n=1 Tax=Candidatus Planktophila dulcis TaxID=1884914 RepID=A0AAC9YUA4_9ACTN|nr:substrate-binding domain-containing protein [Candidatus Planktophila dulcis]ASY12625.1 LacI family transcriptional regulator [Candidatus Planktophila dulcis]ASY21873.1 LacI family transcriptional regulator [Candidatus Planktophila dulcis]
MSVSLRDVAKAAKVSVGTVSNVLNRPEVVAPETLARVQGTIKDLGFVPNGFARHLRSGNSRTLGLIVPDVANPFFTEVARGVEDAASKRDYAVFLCNSDESATKEDRYINILIEQQVRGVLITPTDVKSDRLDAMRERGIAVTLVDREIKGRKQCSVSVDDIHGGQLGIEYLTGLGHTDIAWVCGPDSIPQVADRGAGVAKAAKFAGATVETIRVSLMNTTQGEEAAKKILALKTIPTAIFCANDLLALGVMRTLRENKLRIPEQVSVLGYDDIEFAASAAVPLSSISQPAYQMGVTAADLLLNECEEAETHEHQQIRFQPQLVERASTGKR